MDEVEMFIEEFVQEEYLLWKMAYEERDDELFWDARSAFNEKYYANKDMETDVRRRRNPDDEWFKEAHTFLEGKQKRKLFMIKKFAYAKLGELYGVYLSSSSKGSNSFHELIYLARIKGKLKIISSYITDLEGGFEHFFGARLDKLPDPIKVVKYSPPSDLADLEEYEST